MSLGSPASRLCPAFHAVCSPHATFLPPQAELILHLILLVDRLPVLNLLLGIASHIAYFRLLKRFPYISVTSTDGLVSTGQQGRGKGHMLTCVRHGNAWQPILQCRHFVGGVPWLHRGSVSPLDNKPLVCPVDLASILIRLDQGLTSLPSLEIGRAHV